jgi:hypothetical protein
MDGIKRLVASQGSISVPLLDVYETDEENFIPYRSGDENLNTETSEEKSEETTDDESTGFKLHQGEIIETHHIPNLFNEQWDFDYDGIQNTCTIILPYNKNLLGIIYKGVRCALHLDWEVVGEHKKIKDLPKVFMGFVTDSSFNDTQWTLNISGMDKLLEKKDTLSYKQMHRSKIIEEVIKTFGLKAKVDFTGLTDDVIDWSSKSSNDDGGNSSGDGSMTESEAWEIAQSWGYAGLSTNHDPELAWKIMGTKKGMTPDCYDATAWLYYVLNFKVGMQARDICYASGSPSGTHHTIQVRKNGKWIDPPQYSKMTRNLGLIKGHTIHVCRKPPNGKTIAPWSNCPHLKR